MKKIGLLFCLTVLCLTQAAQAQQWTGDYSVYAGVTFPRYFLSDISSGVSREAAPTVNGQLGALVSIYPTQYVGFETGLSVAGLGAKLERSEFGTREVTQHTYWLQAPLSIVGRMPFSDSSYVFLNVGGYIGYGLYGKNYLSGSYDGSASEDVSFGNDGTQQSIDYGFQMGIGYQTKRGYRISFNYLAGIRDVAPDKASYDQRNGAFSISIGYRF
ncbi:outer membrane beta-barrel protein [Parapedobacter sp. DT-150]|uniref:outer membrane beta-barrel protein n=1 Tax=Parapedobacter sp. DT-150 TaxID=3396162 RepID=UPI003F1B3632